MENRRLPSAVASELDRLDNEDLVLALAEYLNGRRKNKEITEEPASLRNFVFVLKHAVIGAGPSPRLRPHL